MMYPEELVAPMRKELVDHGFKELFTADDVNASIKQGTVFVVVNSVCGCAAGSARPAAILALQNTNKKPEHLYTVFAGMEVEAVDKVRNMTLPYPPSSPSMALFKDGELLHVVERMHIEGRTAEMIADHLVDVFNEYC